MIAAWPAGVPSFAAAEIPQLFSSQAQAYFCDVINGNDGNDGKSPSSPVKTLGRGYQLLRSNQHDTLYLIGLGTAFTLDTGSLASGAGGFTWAKNYAHLVGICAPTLVSQRARITNGATLMTPMFTVTGTGCVFRNVQFANFGSDAALALIGVELNGAQRCAFANCHIAGMGGATTATETAGRSLVLTNGASENVFSECAIGLDTVDRTAANYEIEFTAPACARNLFDRCTILRRSTGSGNGGGFLKLGTDTIDRWLIFRDCIFINSTVGGGATLTTAFSITTGLAPGGLVILKNCMTGGATGLTGGSNTSLIVDFLPGAATSELGLTPTS